MSRARIYHWEKWFAWRRFTLLRGEHYECSQSTMSQTVRNAASERRLRVRLRDTGTAIHVDVVGRTGDAVHDSPPTPEPGQYPDALAPTGPP